MIDDNVLLDHAFYIGLYLAVLDRRNLALVESGFYNTSKLPELSETKSSYWISHGTFSVIDDFEVSRAMA